VCACRYLDGRVRVTRGGDGSLFIFARERGNARPMLSAPEREALYSEAGEAVVTGKGVATDEAPPELQQLLKVSPK
jgi:hypothetical protein